MIQKQDGPFVELVESIRGAIYRAHHDGLPVFVALDTFRAGIVADAIEYYVKRIEAMAGLNPVADVADQMMQDVHTRALLAVTDLELLLENFVGRPLATIEQIRAAQTAPVLTSPRGKSYPMSDSLRRSIRDGKIGDPREPGSEG